MVFPEGFFGVESLKSTELNSLVASRLSLGCNDL